ncbi:hypothetical protein FCI23_22955 [Actinacidiphila oryziradicis]|uniref:Recombinase zinc beta ribbon domain-containing protein n=1 Tax=Actinacidiphila oryziradicis TaxID=2571141 RepID=A0A4U0SKD1_9ACTN|nr:hypothetical protein FCI23_22955 [Actinacidiphila oryziradicis]
MTRILRDHSMNSVCLDFEKRDILAPSDYRRAQRGKPARNKRAQWCPETIRNILTSPTVRGHMSHDGETVHGDDGMPVRVGPALVNDSEWARLQSVMEKKTRTRTEGAAPLLDVAWCDCGAKYHLWQVTQKLKSGPKRYRYYRCERSNKKQCDAAAIKADYLEALVSAYVCWPTILGELEVERKVLIPGEDHTAELAQVRDAVQRLTNEKDAADDWDDEDERAYLSRMAKLRERRRRLAALPQRADEWRMVGTGETYAQLWERSDWPERRRLLIDGVFTVVAYRPKSGQGGASSQGETQILMAPGPERLQGREIPRLPPTLGA